MKVSARGCGIMRCRVTKQFLIGPVTALLMVFLWAGPLGAFSDQITIERMIGENKAFITFMDSCVTNFGESLMDRYKEIYQIHFNAEVAYLQSDYRGAFKRIYASQGKQADFYSDLLKNEYLEKSKGILDRLAPEIIRSKNSRAKLYLTLAYRDRAIAMNFFTIGTASNPRLHSYRIYKFIESIKMSRRAKRYGFLALYESQTNEMKARIFNHLFEMEREKGNQFYNRFLSKSGDSFLEELNRETETETKESEKVPSLDGKERAHPGIDKEAGSFEKRIERRVRFRQEKKVAGYLLNAEFEKAEDLIREYVEDFNFKIIKATIEVLSAQNKQAGASDEYKMLLLHHTDNYSRFAKNSALESFAGSVKVEDFVDKKSDKAGEGDKTPKDNSAMKDTKESEKKIPGDEVEKKTGVPEK